MPNPDYSNKPASKLLADRLANKSNSGNNSEGLPLPVHQQLAVKELKTNNSAKIDHLHQHIPQQLNKGLVHSNSEESSSSPPPEQIQSSGEASRQASPTEPNKAKTHNLSIGTIDSFLPVAEVDLNQHSFSMSSDEDSPKEKKSSRHATVDGATPKKKKSSRRKGQERDEKKKKKEKDTVVETTAGNDIEVKMNGGRRSEKMRKARDVSFSGSTIKRAEIKDVSFNDSSDSVQSALKPSKYGRSSSLPVESGGNTARPRISFGGAAAISSSAPVDNAATERRKLMFQRAAGSKSNLMKPDDNEMQDPPQRSSSLPDRSSDDVYPKQERFQRRQSAPALVKRKSMSSLESANSKTGNLKSRKSVLSGGSVEQMRRVAMSSDDQIYVPPKSRYSSILQAWGHLMAGRVTELVLWTYGASFAKVMLFFLAFYVSNIFTWAFFIMGADTLSTNGNSCLYGDDADNSAVARYEMAFELSWCTFTTVGYGAISPPGDDWGCYPLRLVCALVAFIGVLFGSTTAAIMYSKLMRLLAQAQVTFSSTLCVQYGKGNEGSTVRFGQLNFRASVAVVKLNALDLLNDSDDDEKAGGSDDGYPVIEFRMVNDRANRESSEIWDAQISGVVQLLKEEQPKDGNSSTRDLMAKAEGGESTLDLEKVVYYPVSLSPDSHPHFSRIWYARHVLNAESPLLKREFRDMIAQDGKWDPDFNTWQEIRDCLNPFISLRITLSGTSAVSAASVYAEHVYEFDDVCVGWRFANMVYEDSYKPFKSWWHKLWVKEDETKLKRPDLMTKVDIKLLHDIVPQPGDDHEPLGDGTADEGSLRSKIKFW